MNIHKTYTWAISIILKAFIDEDYIIREAVLVTTDLIDEMRDMPRYTALMGKAAVLDVRIIALEELAWHRLVTAFSELIHQ